MNEVNPLQLLQRCEAGEAAAIDEFVRTYQPTAYRLALSILDDPAEADEAAQDALVAALGRLGSFRGEAAFTTWLYTITLNLCRIRLRKRRARLRLARLLKEGFQLQNENRHPELEVQQIEADNAVWSAIRRLEMDQREAIVLRYYHDLPIANIARVTGVTERTVYKRLRAAQVRLRVLMKEKDNS